MTSLDITAFEQSHNDQSITHDTDATIRQLNQADSRHRVSLLMALSYEQALKILQQIPLLLVREILNELKE